MRLPESVWQLLTFPYAAVAASIAPARRYRFVVAAAPWVKRAVGPMLDRRADRFLCSSLLDQTIRVLLRALARKPMRFDPTPRVDDPDGMVATTVERGAILLTAHFALNPLAVRLLHDHGCATTVVRAPTTRDRFVWGTSAEYETLVPHPSILVSIRERIRPGRAVLMAIDRIGPEGRTVPVALGSLAVYLSTSIFPFARRLGIPVYFVCVRSDADGEPAVIARRIEPEVEAFAAHLLENAAQSSRKPTFIFA